MMRRMDRSNNFDKSSRMTCGCSMDSRQQCKASLIGSVPCFEALGSASQPPGIPPEIQPCRYISMQTACCCRRIWLNNIIVESPRRTILYVHHVWSASDENAKGLAERHNPFSSSSRHLKPIGKRLRYVQTEVSPIFTAWTFSRWQSEQP